MSTTYHPEFDELWRHTSAFKLPQRLHLLSWLMGDPLSISRFIPNEIIIESVAQDLRDRGEALRQLKLALLRFTSNSQITLVCTRKAKGNLEEEVLEEFEHVHDAIFPDPDNQDAGINSSTLAIKSELLKEESCLKPLSTDNLNTAQVWVAGYLSRPSCDLPKEDRSRHQRFREETLGNHKMEGVLIKLESGPEKWNLGVGYIRNALHSSRLSLDSYPN
ncbi:hypothetical protein CR513_48395, partial [Mucuna pruriens]